MNSDTGYAFRVVGCELLVANYKIYHKNTESFYFVLSPFRVFVIGFNYFKAKTIC